MLSNQVNANKVSVDLAMKSRQVTNYLMEIQAQALTRLSIPSNPSATGTVDIVS
jgi:hypothetical protein